MTEVRGLEGKIAVWQDHLRDRVHKNQIKSYRMEGECRVD